MSTGTIIAFAAGAVVVLLLVVALAAADRRREERRRERAGVLREQARAIHQDASNSGRDEALAIDERTV